MRSFNVAKFSYATLVLCYKSTDLGLLQLRSFVLSMTNIAQVVVLAVSLSLYCAQAVYLSRASEQHDEAGASSDRLGNRGMSSREFPRG